MAGSKRNLADGCAIVFATSGFDADVTAINWSGINRASVDVSHLGLTDPGAGNFGNKLFLPSKLVDAGELELTINFDPDDDPPMHAEAETITLTFAQITGDTSPASWAGSGFASGFSFNGAAEGKLEGTITVKFTGGIAMTDAA